MCLPLTKFWGYPSSSGKKKAVEVLIGIRILKFIQILVYGTKPSIQGWKDLSQDLVIFMKFFHDPEAGLRDL